MAKAKGKTVRRRAVKREAAPVENGPAMAPAEFKRIREKVLGLTQPALGARMGLSYLSIYRYEAGSRPISKDRATHLLDIVQLREQQERVVDLEGRLERSRERLKEARA